MEKMDDLTKTNGKLVREKISGRIFTVTCISRRMVILTHDCAMFLTPLAGFFQAMEFVGE
jgi:hypothetical protein